MSPYNGEARDDVVSSQGAGARLIVVSNRLPFVLSRKKTGEWNVQPGSGGLVNALLPVLRNRGGLWVGWTGAIDGDVGELETALAGLTKNAGYRLKPVEITAEERDKFYYGFSNEVIWPLFHDLQTNCNFDPAFWRVYQQVNRKFAAALRESSEPSDFIWVHDYHLMEVARELRRMDVRCRLGFFLHIPFPPLDIFLKLPWRSAILRGLLEFDLIGFQTLRDRRNFLQCVRALVKGTALHGKGQVVELELRNAQIGGVGDMEVPLSRQLRIGAFPISIDYNSFAERAASETVAKLAQYFRDNLRKRQMILGIDRLDYTKGIPNRLVAFRNALQRFPALRQRVTLIQQVVPSREDIPEYHNLRLEIEHLVSEINGEFTEPGWVPIHYIFRSLKRDELLAYYRAADVALVTPLKDGMNLVAKEYCAAKVDDDGVLILSEFAGAAAQLQKGALLVNPHDVQAIADRIQEAFAMTPEQARVRMRRLRRTIRETDIFWWVDSYLRAAIEKDLSAFPLVEDYDYLPETESVLTQ
ncbi:MAG: trehalose-6-phosphate synthase [Acidiferrobacterales bacterium]